MSRTTSRLRFGIRALLILVAIVAGVFFYLRNGPLLARPRSVAWISDIDGPGTTAAILLRYELHPWTSWRSGREVWLRLAQSDGTTKRSPVGQRVSKLSRDFSGRKEANSVYQSLDEFGSLPPEAELAWSKNWGNPEVILDEFVEDNDVEVWTAEAFLEWIGERTEE